MKCLVYQAEHLELNPLLGHPETLMEDWGDMFYHLVSCILKVTLYQFARYENTQTYL